MKMKQFRITVTLAAAALILAAYGFGYHRGYSARGPGAHFGRDTADTLVQGAAQATYEPYFSKANPIPSQVR
ncbi:MAG TPA: hypothetical protein VLT36_03155 [Candidatus Dormibacteraeota bacterium]|nr:hypothetical protein [Candidatus Dormibacteraeota bacterium]